MRQVQRRTTAPYCTCTKRNFSYTNVGGRWVHPCCYRISKAVWLSDQAIARANATA